jgi:hypothetical protein
MDSGRNITPMAGGHAADRQPLLPSPLSSSGHFDADTAHASGREADDQFEINTLVDSRMKLGATALNFFLSGIAMAAVGVGNTAHTCTTEVR